MPIFGEGDNIPFDRGNKLFELSNHLGNVLVTVNDKKLGVSSNNSTVDYFEPQVSGAQDYYPFGMLQPGRSYNAGGYRFGFNGKENDNEVKGEGNQQDYGMRIYDPRLGKFLSVDPLTKDYPWYTPYQFAGNTPIQAIDLDGEEEYHYSLTIDKQGKTQLNLLSVKTENQHNWFGIEFSTSIDVKRYVVDFNNNKYYIGFAGAYGRGNQMAGSLFEEFAKNPDANDFPNLFLNENQSYAVEASRIVTEIAMNRVMYGKLTQKNTPAAKDEKPTQVTSAAGQQKAATNPRSAPNVHAQEEPNAGITQDVSVKRVKPRKSTIEAVDKAQPRNSKGQMVDPYSGKRLKEKDLGHKPGQEWWRRKKMHEERGSTRKQVIEAENNPKLYHWEDRSSNRSHKHEKKN
jgi:RHS repeat-associated protein